MQARPTGSRGPLKVTGGCHMPDPQLGWTREEVILAMDFYVRAGGLQGRPIPGQHTPEVIALSELLRKLNAHPPELQGEKYRNPNGVYMKLMNLRAVEAEGAHGMRAFSQMDAAVWRDCIDHLPELHDEAARIRELVESSGLDPVATAATVSDVDIEQQHTETFTMNPSAAARQAERAEQKLVLQYHDHLAAKGVVARRKKYVPAGEVWPLFCDVWVEERRALIEAKNSDSRIALRQAIGQLHDYRRFHESPIHEAVLLPYRPEGDRMDLLDSAGIHAVWPHGTLFRDNAHGMFV